MEKIITSSAVYCEQAFSPAALHIENDTVSRVSAGSFPCHNRAVLNFHNCIIIPGLIDVHVHLREPGYLYKEGIASGTAAAAHGGYTTVCSMPNLDPVPDSLQHLQPQLDAIARDALIRVHPYASITVNEAGEQLSDMAALAPLTVAFSDDGRGVQDADMMLQAMQCAAALGKMIVAHCEDNSLLRGGYIHRGRYAERHGHAGICSESEWGQIKRDLQLVRQSGCAYHVCHISTKESVALIRQAKTEGLNVSCETAPHYLLLDDSCLQEDGRFKMNPPLRDVSDREALLEGIIDGTIDMIATDHAPHSAQEKSRGLMGSAMGISGLECAFPLLYTYLVKKGIISLEQLIKLMHDNPAQRFGLGNALAAGQSADLSVFDLEASYSIDPNEWLSRGKATPFSGWQVQGKCLLTMCGGHVVWQDAAAFDAEGGYLHD